jgi:group I intron endonuclease
MGMSDCGVYMMLNVLTGTRYVGSTAVSFSNRKSQHLSKLRKHKSLHLLLQKAWSESGGNAFQFVILEVTTPETAIVREQWWLDHFAAQGLPLYNRCPNAASHEGMKMPEWIGEYMRSVNVGRKRSPETCARIGLAHRGKKDPKIAEAKAKDWPDLLAPDGTVYTNVRNLAAFAAVHGLDKSALHKVGTGNRPSHKGWRLAH